MITISGPTLLQLLLLGGLQCRGDTIKSVTQWPPFQVTLTKKSVNINCTVNCRDSPECDSFILSFYKLDPQGKVVPLAGYPKHINLGINTTAFSSTYSEALLWDSSFQDIYYCNATWGLESKKDKGYKLLQEDYRTLRLCLIAFLVILVVVGCAETAALLLWKKKGYPLWPHGKSCQKDTGQQEATPCISNTVETCKTSVIYTSLQPCQANLYDVFEGACGHPKDKDLPGPNQCDSEVQHFRKNEKVKGQAGKMKRKKRSKRVEHKIPKSASETVSTFDNVYENL
uniref:NFAT activation molecule 1 isoform X2 n=1 Tax=Geotrypetes seraphini TaxID=260995 RepID=A0A6P8PGR0_GEOSA|nr:NFAT activation molecule 1 isoform X2 [Geotrypetes seraphini]